MCGLAGVLTSHGLSDTEKSIFNQMLLSGVFRGQDSTGVMSIAPNQGCRTYKSPVPSYSLFENVDYNAWLKEGPTPSAMLVHHRSATSGSLKESHPFIHGNICLMMNGTVNNQNLLPDFDQFKKKVDSDHVAYSFNKLGTPETLAVLDSPFALVWYDRTDNSVNLIKNNGRPLFLIKRGPLWAYSSEADMVKWIMGRKTWNTTQKNDEEFEAVEGLQYKFTWSKSGQLSLETIKRELYKEPPIVRGFLRKDSYFNFHHNGYDSNSQVGNLQDQLNLPIKTVHQIREDNRPQAGAAVSSAAILRMRTDLAAKLLIRHNLGVALEDTVEFTAFSFTPYTKGTSRGFVTGYATNLNGYVEVLVHALEKEVAEHIIEHELVISGILSFATEHVYTQEGKVPFNCPVLTITKPDLSAIKVA